MGTDAYRSHHVGRQALLPDLRPPVARAGLHIHDPSIPSRATHSLVHGGHAQLMDKDSVETFEMAVPEEFSEGLVAGADVSYLVAMGRQMITKM